MSWSLVAKATMRHEISAEKALNPAPTPSIEPPTRRRYGFTHGHAAVLSGV